MRYEEAKAELVQSIKECGQSIIDNAEKIVNNYEFLAEDIDIHISLSVNGNELPAISVDNVFLPERYFQRKAKEGKLL